MDKLEKIMMEEWGKVRKSYHFPALPDPILTEKKIDNAWINLKNLQIEVARTFIAKLEKLKIKPRHSLNEILGHETGHFMRYPGSVLNTLRLLKAAKEVVTDDEKAESLRRAFVEAQVNIYMYNVKKNRYTPKVSKAGYNKKDKFDTLMHGLYQAVWKRRIGIKLDKKQKGLVKQLKEINYVDQDYEKYNLKKFVAILKDYNPPKKQCSGAGLKMFSMDQIKKGIKEFAKECSTPGEFEGIVKSLLLQSGIGKKGEDGKLKQDEKSGGIGNEKGALELANNIYTALAELFAIPIKKKPIKKSGGLIPYAKGTFGISSPLADLDGFSTPKVYIGITKRMLRREGETSSAYEKVPNSVIVIDNSGSMPDPIKGISLPVIGATVISNAYLYGGSKVSVYNFGGADKYTELTKDSEKVHEALRYYTGGGTTFTPEIFLKLLEEHNEEFDVSVVSDMGIDNLEEFIETIEGIPNNNRIHLVCCKNTWEGSRYEILEERFGDHKNIGVVKLYEEEDINKITMGEVSKSVK